MMNEEFLPLLDSKILEKGAMSTDRALFLCPILIFFR